jgi:hypothetical protein
MQSCLVSSRRWRVSRVDCVVATYHGDDLGLDGLVQGDQAEVEGEVEL